MNAQQILNLSNDEVNLLIDIARAMKHFETEIARSWYNLYVEFKILPDTKQRSEKDFRNALKLLLTSLYDGNLNNYLKRIQKMSIKFAKEREKYENLLSFFHMYEISILPFLQRAFPKETDRTIRTLEHLYHGLIAIMSRSFFNELDKERERFLSTLVHDLRNPLIGMTGFAKILIEKKLSKNKEVELLKIIRDSGEMISSLINSALAYGRLKSGKATLNITDINICEIINEAITFLLPEIENRSISVIINGHSRKDLGYLAPVRMKGDRELILRAIGNYLSNAIKYARAKVGITVKEKDNNVIISVKDDGPGIPKNEIPLIFEEYYKAVDSKAGTGIGLSCVKMIADLHKGKAYVESEHGKGSTFYLVLPKKHNTSRSTKI